MEIVAAVPAAAAEHARNVSADALLMVRVALVAVALFNTRLSPFPRAAGRGKSRQRLVVAVEVQPAAQGGAAEIIPRQGQDRARGQAIRAAGELQGAIPGVDERRRVARVGGSRRQERRE